MTEAAETFDDFESAAIVRDDEALLVQVDGFEGPLDLLLTLARNQKVDIAKISILKLADQYLEFIESAKKLNLELAADYLVMAAWLAYLKSRLLLPEPAPEDEPSGEEMAAALAFQLQRLEAMRQVGEKLMNRPRLGRDVFPRGEPEAVSVVTRPVWEVGLYDLLKAYADIQRRQKATTLRIEAPDLYSVDDAIHRLQTMLGTLPRWSTLSSFLPPGLGGLLRRSAVSAHFVAILELCRQGKLELRQDEVFADIWLKPAEGKRDD